jgi:glutaredoxin
MISLILFTSPTCTRCPVVKRFFDTNGIRCREVDVTDSKGLAELNCRAPGSRELPVLVKVIGDSEEVYGPGDILDSDGNIKPGIWSKTLATMQYDPQTHTWSDA